MVVPEAKEGGDDCVHTKVLMEHVFAFSYGKPFVGMFMILFFVLSKVFYLFSACYIFSSLPAHFYMRYLSPFPLIM